MVDLENFWGEKKETIGLYTGYIHVQDHLATFSSLIKLENIIFKISFAPFDTR